MAHLLAVDWDQHETRYLLASVTGSQVRIEAAAAVPLVDVVEGGEAPHPDVGNSLRAALAEQKVGRATTLVSVDRASLEVIQATLPPAQDAELPDMIANQLLRDAPQVTEEWVVDFLPLNDSPHAPRPVIATALGPEPQKRILATCEVAGLKPARLLFRPLATVSCVTRLTGLSERVSLIVSRLTDEVDLILVVEGKPNLLRTVRLPNIKNEEKSLQRLLAEVNRTAAVALQNEADGGPVERVYLLGGSGARNRLADRITNQLFLPVTLVDPFDGVEIDEALQPDDPGRFAPLVGMLLDEVHQGHAVDFLHPRKRPQPPNYRRMGGFAAALVTALVLAAGYSVYGGLADLDVKIKQLDKSIKDRKELLKKAKEQQRVVDSIVGWQRTNVVWLDELRDLSLRLPSARDLIALHVAMGSGRDGGGVIDLQCLVRDPSVVLRLEQAIRDQYHEVNSKDPRQRGEDKGLTWQYSAKMSAMRRDKEQYRPAPPPKEPAADKATDKTSGEQKSGDKAAEKGTSDKKTERPTRKSRSSRARPAK